MDGRIKAIKQGLIDAGLGNKCTLMSYSAKFASSLYGPFRYAGRQTCCKDANHFYREAAGSAPSFGDRKCYQLPPNAKGLARRAIVSVLLVYYYSVLIERYQQRDANEGADIIMVKPALPYLDIIADAAQLTPDHPLACYQVSGEYAMVVAGARAGVYELRAMAFESVESMIRAGEC